MRTFVTLLVFTIIFQVKGDQNYTAIRENCMKDIGITPESYKAAIENEKMNLELDANIKCLDACLLKYLGIMADDGILDSDKILKFITDSPDDQQLNAKKRIIETCIAIKGDSDCDTAYNLMNCMSKEMSKLHN